jgi:tRNA(Ile)-lysidine synthase
MTNLVAQRSTRFGVEARLAEAWPPPEWCVSHVLLAVSGGADSVALLRAMASLKTAAGGNGKLFVGHLNHGRRGRAADADEAWVNILCRQLAIPVILGRADVASIAASQGDGWEAAARSARYDFLRQSAERLGARFVATAHTADDQVETVLHRILRGTGIGGLAGIPRSRRLSASVTLVRPLLTLRRQEVLDYLAAIGQDFRTDDSNEDTSWTRNRLRNELLPHLRERYNPKVDAALERLSAQAIEFQQVIADFVAGLASDCVVVEPAFVQIDCRKLDLQPSLIVREVCRTAWRQAGWPEQSMGFDEWQQLASLAKSAPSPGSFPTTERWNRATNLPGHTRARRNEQFLILERPVGSA